MTIGFILNGEDVVIQCGANDRLVDILREKFHLMGAKSGCRLGRCGSCSVIFNGSVVPSCMIPAFRVRSGEVITVEGFSQTDEYQDIISAFARTGLETCSYCDTAKIFTAEMLMEQNSRPGREEALAAAEGILCRCTDPELLSRALILAADIRQRRLYGRST